MEENTTPSVLDEFQDDHLLSETDLEVFSLLSNSSEAMAREARAAKDYSYQTMENILMAAHRNLQPLASNNRRWGDSDTTRLLLGGYSHGAFARLTKNTRRYQEFTHYINDYLAHHVPHHTWTSLMISFNCGTTVHQDHHNLSGSQNVLHCLGHFEHGGLWLQGTPPDGYEVTRRRLMDGNCSNGHVVNARYRIVTFDPKTSHTTQAWRGFRITISSYTTRLLPQMTREDRAQLQRHSFRLTSSTTTSSMNQAVMMPVEASPLGGQDENQSVSNEERERWQAQIAKLGASRQTTQGGWASDLSQLGEDREGRWTSNLEDTYSIGTPMPCMPKPTTRRHQLETDSSGSHTHDVWCVGGRGGRCRRMDSAQE